MPLWVSAAATTVCAASGMHLLWTRRERCGYLAGGILLLLAGVAFALYTVATILLVSAID